MSKERELIKDMKILLECTDMGGLQRNADVLIGRAIELLAQQEPKSKIDFKTLSELGLKRLQVSDSLILQESCSISPALIFAENGEVIDIIGYKKVLEIKSFLDCVLNYADTPQG